MKILADPPLPRPTLELKSTEASAGDIVPMRIYIPPPAPNDGVSGWTYGYTADLSRRTDSGWDNTHTLVLGMGNPNDLPDPMFARPGYWRAEAAVMEMMIGFGGTRTVDVEIPPVGPGLYRVTMDFGYDNTEDRPEAVVHETIQISS